MGDASRQYRFGCGTGEVRAVKADAPPAGGHQTGQGAHERGFAGAVGAHQACNAAGLNLEGGVPQHLHVAVA